MYFTWTEIKKEFGKDEAPTPESLRAAAKVLEEKAKELDEPKLTDHQKKVLEAASNMGHHAQVFRDGKTRDVNSEGEYFSWEDWKEYKQIHSYVRWTGDTCVTIVNYLDEDGDLCVGIKYPK